MHVGDAPSVVAEARGLRPRPHTGGAPHQDGAPRGGVSEVAKTMHGQTPPLSSESLGAAIAAQGNEVSAAAAHGRSSESPAARARALIESDPSLAARPFGQIVSALARGVEVAPAFEDDDPGPEAEGDAGESPNLAEGPDLAPPPPEVAVEEAVAEVLEEMVGVEEDAGA